METKKYEKIIENSVKKFLTKESELLSRGIDERCVQFRFGLYFNEEIKKAKFISKEITLDAEYQKNGEGTKGVYRNCKYNCNGCNNKSNCYMKSHTRDDYKLDTGKKYAKTVLEFAKDTKENKYMRPDLILHERMERGNTNGNNNNLIAIELKISNKKNSNMIDFAKLTYLTCDCAEYEFHLGAHIFLDESKSRIKYFKDGKELKDTNVNL